jgi:hypothetical protein
MQVGELFEVLKRINHEREAPVDDALLERIIAPVVMHPLNEDRSQCQDEIMELIIQQSEGKAHDH